MDYSNSIKIKLMSIVIVFLIFSTASVLALGVSTPYWKNHPLEMYPGQIKNVDFLLVNKFGNPTAEAIVALDESAGISEITSGKDYSVAGGARNVKVTLQVSVPKSAIIGDNYDIKFSIKSIPEENQGGNIQLGVGYVVQFPVQIVSEESIEKPIIPAILPDQEEKGTVGYIVASLIIWTVLIAGIILIVFWIYKRRKQV